MGSSAKKKKEKKADHKKLKLKVGKAKPKAANHTDTSFRSKAIVINQQSLTTSAPTSSSQFSHYTSLLSSKSDAQRRDSLAFLTTYVSSRPVDSALPQPVSFILPKLLPLILDGSNGVRQQLVKLLRALPEEEIKDHAPDVLPYIRAGMTHLSADIRVSGIDTLSWLLDAAGDEVVSCAGGFVKTMNCFLSMLNWNTTSSGTKFGKAGTEGKSSSKILQVLGKFLQISMAPESMDSDEESENSAIGGWPIWHMEHHMIPTRSNAYGYLGLFGPQRGDDSEMLEDKDDRIGLYNSTFKGLVEAGVDQARREGGEIGRSLTGITAALKAVKASSDD